MGISKLHPPSYWDIFCQAFEAAGPEQATRAKDIRVVLWEQVWNVPSTLKGDLSSVWILIEQSVMVSGIVTPSKET